MRRTCSRRDALLPSKRRRDVLRRVEPMPSRQQAHRKPSEAFARCIHRPMTGGQSYKRSTIIILTKKIL